jgi:hypothetical protein
MKRKPQPKLGTPARKTDYIGKHLFNELRWLLAAATEWYVQHTLKLGMDGYHVQVYAMDSACLHSRALFEFFTKPTGLNYYGCDQFLSKGSPLVSSANTKGWEIPLHGFLMHAQDRSSPVKLRTLTGRRKDLNRMPVDFAKEILRLWEEFELKLGTEGPDGIKLQTLAHDKRREAIEGAKRVVDSLVAKHHAAAKHALKPVFT